MTMATEETIVTKENFHKVIEAMENFEESPARERAIEHMREYLNNITNLTFFQLQAIGWHYYDGYAEAVKELQSANKRTEVTKENMNYWIKDSFGDEVSPAMTLTRQYAAKIVDMSRLDVGTFQQAIGSFHDGIISGVAGEVIIT